MIGCMAVEVRVHMRLVYTTMIAFTKIDKTVLLAAKFQN